MAFALLLGLLANFTVMGSVAPSGIVPLSFCMALSASTRWSKRMKPTPLERPGTEPSLEPPGKEKCDVRVRSTGGSWCTTEPEMLSHSILLVMMFPQEANSLSRSGWVMCFGRPDTYRLAPLMASLLGRAKDTWRGTLISLAWPGQGGGAAHLYSFIL